MELGCARIIGRQLSYDCSGCNEAINSAEAVRAALLDAVRRANVTLLQIVLQEFEPQGITAVAIIAESHVIIHTWPEHGFVTLDVFTCGDRPLPEQAVNAVREAFAPSHIEAKELVRGKAR